MVLVLARVIGIGVETADMLVQEVLSRTIRDRRRVMLALPAPRRKRSQTAREGIGPPGQRARVARHDPAGVAPAAP
jgi:hypothetical protein